MSSGNERNPGSEQNPDGDQNPDSTPHTGKVYLVGAGPGDPGLLTVKGREVLLACDAVVYDRLAATALPPDLPAAVELHYVGKMASRHTLPQPEINALLVELARAGKTVCRFKGGDPFVFGRGGEEAEALKEAGIPYEVVPGVTAGIAAAAYAGIPVTHRGEAVRVTLVTAHEDPAKPTSQVDWKWLGEDPHGTLVGYMPVANLPVVAAQLIAGGMNPETPAAVIECGTLACQRTVSAPLWELASVIQRAGIHPPAVFVVGKTVALREKLAWFEERPLHGRRVVVTRPADQAVKLIDALHALGIEPLVCPVIRTERNAGAELAPYLGDLDGYDWVFFTSENGVRHFFGLLRTLDLDVRSLGGTRIAAIGRGTDQRLAQFGLKADFVPSTFQSTVMLQEFRELGSPKGLRILRVRGDNAPESLEEGLREAGAVVDVVTAYRVLPERVRPEVAGLLEMHQVDAVTFTSASSVRGFEDLLPGHGLHADTAAVCIGPVTAEEARQAGWQQVITAEVNTIAGLVETLGAHLRGRARPAGGSSPAVSS
jgi:uroporphyrinogen III methyltransferase/synthase